MNIASIYVNIGSLLTLYYLAPGLQVVIFRTDLRVELDICAHQSEYLAY